MVNNSEKIILTNEEIQEICKKLGHQITELIKNDNKPAVVVGVLKGAVPFMNDLVKNIDAPILVDYVQIKSYSGMNTTGKVQLLRDISFDCEDRTVIVVEDIVDTGLSMSFLLKHINTHNPKRVAMCTLFDKAEARKVPVQIDFVGKILEGQDFLLGYGLDYNNLCRNIPYVFAATPAYIEYLDKILKK